MAPKRRAKKFEIRHECRIRGPARIPTMFQNQSTKKSKCQPAQVLPTSKEEPGSQRTRCSIDPVHHRTHQDRQFDLQHQQLQRQFNREFTQSFQKTDVDPRDQFDQNLIQRFDADPTEKFDQSNSNQTV